MECTVRNGGSGIGDESRLLELEKLQQLVQELQLQNEQLMAAANTTQNGENHKQSTTNLDPPRDSGIDLSASCSEELEDDILDFGFDMPEDDESWLYSTPAVKSQGDVLSWLRKDVNSLDPAARRALANKLEILIAKKQNDARKVANKDSNSSPINNVMGGNGTTPIPLVGILDFDIDEECLLPLSPQSNNNSLLSPEVESNRVIARRTTFRVDRKSPEAAAVANASGSNSATYNRPKKTSPTSANASKELLASSGQKQQRTVQQLAPAPALTITDEPVGSVASAGTSPGRKTTFDVIHPELTTDIHKIQLLASMQEEELRKCLLEMNRRRRTSSGNQKDGDASSVMPSANANGGTNAPTNPVIPAKASDRFGTYTKPKQRLMVGNTPNGLAYAAAAADADVGEKLNGVAGRKVASSTTPPQTIQQPLGQDAISTQKGTGLQKSLPNLSGSRSEFNLPAPSFPVDTASEKGSYGDIPSVLNPPNRSQATTSSTSRLAGPGSRLPTPARSRLPTPRTGIPMPRAGPSLPVPVASARPRTKSPATRPSIANTPKTQPARENWNEGCF